MLKHQRLTWGLVGLLAIATRAQGATGCHEGSEAYRLGVDASRSLQEREQSLLEAAARCPQDPCVLTDLGDLHEISGRLDQAEVLYGRAILQDASFVPAVLGQAGLALARSAPREAADLYAAAWDADFATTRECPSFERATDQRCGTVGCELVRALHAFELAGRDRLVRKVIEDIEKRRVAATAGRDLRKASVHAREQGWHSLAIRDLSAIVQLESATNPGAGVDAWLSNELGLNHGLQGQWAEAVKHFETARDAAPGWAEPLLNLGHARYVMADHAAAADTYRAAWSLAKEPLSERAMAEMLDSEARIGREGVLVAGLIEGVIRTKGVRLGRPVYDAIGMPVGPGVTPPPPPAQPQPDRWPEVIPKVTQVTVGPNADRSDRGGPQGLSCNPDAPLRPASSQTEQSFDVRIEFEFGKATLQSEATSALDQLARGLQAAVSRVYDITLGGHTDCIGATDFNDQLSRDRAEAVAAALVARGLPKQLVKVESFGFRRPRATNESNLGRAQNRRVEVKIGW